MYRGVRVFVLGFAFFFSALVCGCSADLPGSSGAGALEFSLDTVRFDTVMHSRVSSMRRVSLRNVSGHAVRVERVGVEGPRAGAFHVVVDGVGIESFGGMLLAAGDSAIFVLQVYTEEYRPDVFEQLDVRIVVESGEGNFSLPARAWNAGWSALDADIRGHVVVPAGGIRYVETKTEVEAGATLTLSAGVTLLFGNGAELIVRGGIEALGTARSRVSLLPQRMEPYYMRKPGQWAGVSVGERSSFVRLSHLDLRGAVVGVGVKGKPLAGSVEVENCRVLYCSQDGLRLERSEAEVRGSIFGQNYRHGVSLLASKASMIHCTVCAESMPPQTRIGESIWLDDGAGSATLDIENSIIWGDRQMEIGVKGGGELGGRLRAANSVVRVPEDLLGGLHSFTGCTTGDPHLVGRAQGLYYLGGESSGRLLGRLVAGSATLTDLYGTLRDVASPDAGAVEMAR